MKITLENQHNSHVCSYEVIQSWHRPWYEKWFYPFEKGRQRNLLEV